MINNEPNIFGIQFYPPALPRLASLFYTALLTRFASAAIPVVLIWSWGASCLRWTTLKLRHHLHLHFHPPPAS